MPLVERIRRPIGRDTPLTAGSPSIKAQPRGKLEGLEAGRGIAAMMVLLCHSASHCLHAYGSFPLGRVFAFGHAGVDFFFVLSGFIIFHAHRRDLGRPGRMGRYLERRLTRIYPLYWIVLAATLGTALLSSHPFPGLEHIVVSALLSPTVGEIIIVDAWTLQHEMLFYGIFAFLIFNKRLGLAVFAGWLAFLVTCTQMSFVWQSGLLSKLSSYFNFEFFLGMTSAWLAARGEPPRPKLLVFLGLAAFLAVGVSEDLGLIINANIYTHAGYGLSATAVVIGLVAWERQSGFSVPPILARLGSASYAIYLVHVLALGVTWQVIQHAGLEDRLGPTVTFMIIAAIATASGVLTSVWVEKPVMAFLRRRIAAAVPAVVSAG
jgi:exopolysaccharide production protein ExoZ